MGRQLVAQLGAEPHGECCARWAQLQVVEAAPWLLGSDGRPSSPPTPLCVLLSAPPLQIAKAWKLDDPKVAASVVPLRRLEDLLRLLRSMPADEVAARQAGVIANRLKFWYPAAPAEALAASAHAAGGASLGMAPGAATATAGSLLQHGGGARRSLAAARGGAGGAGDATLAALAGAPGAQPGASVLGELLMRKMCRRAAAVKKRVAESARQGLDFKDSDEKVEHPALAAQPSGAEAEEGEEVPAATTTRGRKAAGARRQRHML